MQKIIQKNNEGSKGFSLLELLMVITIFIILSVVGSASYRNYNKSVELGAFSQAMSGNMRYVRSKAMIGEGGFKWGVHFVNSTNDYYELFSTPTTYVDAGKVITETDYLPKSITFSDPTEGNTKDVIFDKISGNSTTASVSIVSESVTQTINITSIGTVY